MRALLTSGLRYGPVLRDWRVPVMRPLALVWPETELGRDA
jgi:hypothetical protein